MSKGFVREAKNIANRNISRLAPLISAETPLIGIEPSAVLTLRDEYVDLANDDLFSVAQQLAKNVFTIEEFFADCFEKGMIRQDQFNSSRKQILIHGHCQQKALSSLDASVKMLSIPENYSTSVIPSGCCGMAGSFGYEKEHYDLSMKIGELVLFPALRKAPADSIIAAAGTSCRHQIKDGAGAKALHPVEILWDALSEKLR